MGNVTAKSKWKSVPMDAQLMARGFAEGLMGIEELSSYDLVQVNKKKTVKGKVTKVEDSKVVSKANKRPLTNANSEEEEPPKKKKTRQKRKPKKKNPQKKKPKKKKKKKKK